MLAVLEDRLDWTRFHRLRQAGERALVRGAPGPAKSYLSAALSLWRGTQALSGIDVPPDHLAFVAEQEMARASAAASLVEVRLLLGEHGQMIPQLEAEVALDPADEGAVGRLALAYHRSGRAPMALAVCRRYLELMAEEGAGEPSPAVTDLQSAILRRDPGLLSPGPGGISDGVPQGGSEHRAFLVTTWTAAATPGSPLLQAAVLLLMEDLGGHISEVSEGAVETSFSDVGAAVDAAIEVHRVLGRSSGARSGLHVRLPIGLTEDFEGPPRARARLLAAAARDGQVLVAGAEARSLRRVLPGEARLRALGTHRLNALTPPTPIFQLSAPALPRSRATPRWVDQSAVHNLAIGPFPLIGRGEEVAEVTRRLVDGRLVTLIGAPGSGKTELAAHVAAGLAEEYADGAWFVALETVGEPDMVAGAIADALGVRRRGATDPVDALLRHLVRLHLLVVLDNCEHLVAECRGVVDRLLPRCPGLSVLATSREALGSRLEHTVWVPPLEPPAPAPPRALLANPSVRLFYDRSGSGTPLPEDGHVGAVARICRAVEGLPLALVLAAARAKDLGPDTLADVLEGALGEGIGLEVLSGPEHARASRETLWGTTDWSYRLLEQRERLLLESLSIFSGGFTIEDAVAVCAQPGRLPRSSVVAGLDRLVQTSLVATEGAEATPRRFRLLQPVREFAAAKLRSRSRRAAAALGRRHAMHFVTLAEDAEPIVRGPQDRSTVDRLEAALPDLYAAIRWSVVRKEPRTALRLVGSLWVFWLVRGRITEGRQMLGSALATDDTPSPERIRALVGYSCLSWFGGDLTAAREGCRETLAEADLIGDDWGRAWGANGLVAVAMFDASNESVPLRQEEALTLFRRLGHAWDTALALQTLGGAAWHRGRYRRAERAFSEAVEILRSIGHPTLMASRSDHGVMLALLGNLDAGAAEVEQTIVSAYEAGDIAGLAEALCRRGAIARYGGNNDQARSYYRDALRMARDAGEVWALQWSLDGLGSTEGLGLRVPSPRLEAAAAVLARAEVMARETGITLAPREREYHARDLARARARLGDRAFRRAFTRGERLDVDEAVHIALSLDRPALHPVG